MEGSRFGFCSANSENQRGRDDIHTPATISASLNSRGGSVALTSRGGSIVPTSYGGSTAPTSRGGSVALASHVGSISRGGSMAPSSRAVSGLSLRSRSFHGALMMQPLV